MAPLPRPPVICYDVQSGPSQPRQRRFLEPIQNRNYIPPLASSCSNYKSTSSILRSETYQPTQTSMKVLYNDTKNASSTRSSNNTASTYRSRPTKFIPHPQPSQAIFTASADSIFGNTTNKNSAAVRFGYDQKLRAEAKKRERRKVMEQKHNDMREQLERLVIELESVKRAQEHLANTFGMSHNAARHIQRQHEEIEKLNQRIEQSYSLHQKERQKLMQEVQKLRELLKARDELAKKKLEKDLIQYKENLPTGTRNGSPSSFSSEMSSSPPPQEQYESSHLSSRREHSHCQGSQGSSSTVSITSSSSSPSSSQTSTHITSSTPVRRTMPMTPRPIRNNITHLVNNTRERSRQQSILSDSKNRTRTIDNSRGPNKSIHFSTPKEPLKGGLVSSRSDRLDDVSFNFEDSILEITDVNFFHKAEDPTMIEMDALMGRIKPLLNNIAQL